MISGKKLPDIMIVAAANPQGMPILTPQTRRRFLQYDIIFDNIAWKKFMFNKYKLPSKISNKLCSLIREETYVGYNYDTPADLDKAVGMIIKNIATPYETTLLPILSTPIENKLEDEVTLDNGEVIEKNQVITWLDLIRKNDNIDLSLLETDENQEEGRGSSNYEINMLDNKGNVIGEIKNINELQKIYSFSKDEILKLEKGDLFSPLSFSSPSLFFIKKN